MPRLYSNELIKSVEKRYHSHPLLLTACFARACIKANLPAMYVAAALRVTRMTVHNWFRGSPLRDKNNKLVEVFTDLVESDLAKSILPAKSYSEARAYLEDMTGRKIK